MAVSLPDFLRRVIPWPDRQQPVGYVNMHWMFPDKKGIGGKPFQDLDQFLSMVNWCNANPGRVVNIFYCTSLQSETRTSAGGRVKAFRNAEHALGMKTLWADIDIKVGAYASDDEVFKALARILQEEPRLPPISCFVHTGGGIHAYWILDRILSPDEWQAYASGLRAVLEKHGLKFDGSVTIDRARILRVPGTFNWKYGAPRPVRLLGLAPEASDIDPARFDWLKGEVVPRATAKPATSLIECELEPRPPITDPDYLQEIKCTDDHPPVNPYLVISKCPMLNEAQRTHGRDHAQPLWHLVALATTFMDHGRDMFHVLSEGHLDYTPEEANEMFDRKVEEQERDKIGWPGCAAFEAAGSKQCLGCKYRGHVNSPLNLHNFDLAPTPAAPAVAAAAVPFVGNVTIPDNMHLPAGYVMWRDVICIAPQAGKGGRPGTPPVPLFHTQIRPPRLRRGHGLHFQILTDNHEWIKAEYPYRLGGAPECGRWLAKQCVFTARGNDEVYSFMKAWVAEFQRAVHAQEAEPYGWFIDENKTLRWAYAGKSYGPNDIREGALSDSEIAKNYEPAGDIEPWFKALALVTGQKRPELDALVIAASFAGPIMYFTGKHAACLAARGETGSNKSTAINIGLAVWGNPLKTKISMGASGVYSTKAAATVRNLPMVWDDISKPDLIQKVSKVIGEFTEGSGPGKLNPDGTVRPDRGEWQTIMVVGTNKSLFDQVVADNPDHIAQQGRIIEYTVRNPSDVRFPGRISDHDASVIQAKLEENYGRVGEKYSKLLGEASGDIQQMVDREFRILEAAIPPLTSERFWTALYVSIIVGGQLANAIGCNFDLVALQQFMREVYKDMRERVASLTMTQQSRADDLLQKFYNEFPGYVLRTDRIPVNRYDKVALRGELPKNPQQKIYFHWTTESRKFRFTIDHFTKWCRDGGFPALEMLKSLQQQYGAVKHRVNMGAAVSIDCGRAWIYEIDIPPGSWMEEELRQGTPLVDVTHSDQSGAFPDVPASAESPPSQNQSQ